MTMRQYGVIVAAIFVSAAAFLLNGCGAKSAPDTPYKGAYRAAYTIPALNESGTFSFTVEQKGGMTGSFVTDTGTTYAFSGGVASSGYFSGTLKTASVSYPLTGTLAVTTTTTGGGNFQETRDNQSYSGSFSLTASGITPTPSSTFRGAYSGVYNVPTTSQNGVVSFSVDSLGNITGSMTQGTGTSTQTGFLSGTVQATGNFTATVVFGKDTQTLVGVLNATTDGSTSGNFQLTDAGVSNSASFGKSSVPTSGNNPLAGSYNGTYAVPGNGNETGTVSFTVDPLGNITGFFSQQQQQNQPIGTFTGTIGNNGTFSGTIVYSTGTRPITGTIAKSQLNVSDGYSGNFVETINGVNSPGEMEISVGGSEPESIYRGTYGNTNIGDGIDIYLGGVLSNTNPLNLLLVLGAQVSLADSNPLDPSAFYHNVELSLTIDQEGFILGTLGGYTFEGRVTNDSRVIGSLNGYPVQGAFTHQQVEYQVSPIVPATATTALVPAVPAYTPGISGNLTMVVNGVTYNVTIQGQGGVTGGGG